MTEYVELHAHSHYSLLDGASSPAALVERAKQSGMKALALTDHDNVYGAVAFARAAVAQGIRPIHGAEITLESGAHLTLLVEDETGWSNLCHLITAGQHRAPKGECRVPAAMLERHHAGLIALSGCRQGLLTPALLRDDLPRARRIAGHYRELFGAERFWIELQHHHLPADDRLLAQQVQLSREMGIECVATNNVHYARHDEHRLHDVLRCIRHRTTLDEAGDVLFPNSERYLKSGAQMAGLFRSFPDAVRNSVRIAERCQFALPTGLQPLPAYPLPAGQTAAAYLRYLCRTSERFEPRLSEQLSHELAIIEAAGLSNYFLVVWDVVRFARAQGIRCQGRGSAANSVVAYLLHITPVNPLDFDLVFERFLSAERQLAPDIDIDFDAARREEVIQYVYRRYGHEHAAMACTFITYRSRSALREVGKVLGLSGGLVDYLAQSVEPRQAVAADESASPVARQLAQLCQQIAGVPRHLSIHNGGMILTAQPLAQRLPTEPAAMAGRVVVQWDKDSLEDAGMVKVDILGLRMLSAIDEAARLADVDTDALRYDDPAVYDMICDADTIGVFQVESRAQMQVLPRFRPRSFNDLIISISLIRPGPIQGDMVHPYLRRRLGEEPVRYPHPALEPALSETLGVILFQEQVLQVARDLAGFTPGQGELLRRALGRKDAVAAIQAFEAQFVAGAVRRGVAEDVARDVFGRLLGFGSYSFPRSHAAAFAVLVYQSAWLRHYQPAAFYIALLNHQPMGFYAPAVIVQDARRHNIPVYPVDMHRSAARCTPEHKGLRLGFKTIKGMGDASIERLLAARRQRAFTDLADVQRRAGLPLRLIERLIAAGALDAFGERRELLWQAGSRPAGDGELALSYPSQPVPLPYMDAVERHNLEQAAQGLTTGAHPMALYREWCAARNIRDSAALAGCRDGQRVTVAGMLVVRQMPPTAKGYQFLTLEDEAGFINVIVRPAVHQRCRQIIRSTPFLRVRGTVQLERGVVNLVATDFRPLQPN